MPLPGRIFAGDLELGKKNDDHRRANGTIPVAAWLWTTSKPTLRMRRKRIFLGLVAIYVLYLFFRNIPTDLAPVSQRTDVRVPGQSLSGLPLSYTAPTTEQPPHPGVRTPAENHYYNGQIKFPTLGISLHGIGRTNGYRDNNKNVLFAAASLQSASRLLPMACEMARWNRNVVHFVLMGRESLSIQDIQTVNGIDIDCSIFWHDARPDYSFWSSENRMEVSVAGALDHIYTFMHPQVYITDDSSREEAFLTKKVREKAHMTGKSVVELPPDAAKRLMWMTRLDTGSLSKWHTTYIDIVIHALPEASGSLIRLLKSIEAADYFGSRHPHLTIELPPDLDPPTLRFLENLVWPPIDWSGAPHASQVTLRHRIPRQQVGAGEAAAHFLENFYPARPRDSHVLILSPQVELSPLYYQYLLYNVLEYKYSSYRSESEAENLMGISLHLPSRHLNETESFSPPPNKKGSDPDIDTSEPLPFLWQAPNSNAALYFGDKWIELQSFLTSRIYAKQTANHPLPSRPKQISPNHASWMEYLLELMRTRSYSLLYPTFPPSSAITTVHNELFHLPEEFTASSSSNTLPPSQDLKGPFTINPATPPRRLDLESTLLTTPLLTLLPNSGDLPSLSSLAILSYAGDALTLPSALALARDFRKEFRRDIGGCKDGKQNVPVRPMGVEDLFCFEDEDEEEVDVVAAEVKETDKEEKKQVDGEVQKTAAETDKPVEKTKSMLDGYVEQEAQRLAKEAQRLEKEARDMKAEFQTHLLRQAARQKMK